MSSCLPLLSHSIAATILMAANLVRYVTAVPEPVPEADSVRYKVSKKVYSDNVYFPHSHHLLPPFSSSAIMKIQKRWNFKDVSEKISSSEMVTLLNCLSPSFSQLVDNCGGPILPSGEQLYELVRDGNGEGWAIQEARIPTVQPGWHDLTFSPWYR